VKYCWSQYAAGDDRPERLQAVQFFFKRGSMEYRKLGNTDMNVSVLGFGGSEIGYERISPRTAERLLNEALDAGLSVIDTAECYMTSEELIGDAVGKRRSEY
jgi:aryl-alcohol dehydrogenase-like predicted oxidoreductase